MSSTTVHFSVRVATARRPIGLEVVLPTSAHVGDGPPGTTLYAFERLASGRMLGELELSVITPGLIVDRDGVLMEAASRVADELVAPPRDGYLIQMRQAQLPSGEAWRVDAVLQRGKDGLMPELPYQSVLAMGHPDLSVAVALFVVLRSREERWPVGEEILSSMTFTGVAARSAAAAIVLPLPG